MSDHDGIPMEEPATVDPVPVGTEIRRGPLGGRIVAGALGAVLLAGGVAFAATQAGDDGGAETPEAAVEQLLDAMADEDLLGALASLDPGERDTFREPVEDLFEELERLGVVGSSFELTGVDGVDIEFDDVTFRTEPVVDGLARVYVTGGSATYAVDGSELPIGDFLADTLDRFGVDPGALLETDTEEAIAGEDTFLVARDTGDGWRVSIGYTAAEAARESMGAPAPPATGMEAIGADSPEEAVEGLLRAAAAIDIPDAVARLSPDELRALHHYWPVLVDPSELPSADDLDVSVELSELELDADTDGDRAQVLVRRIGADVASEDFTGGATIADGCITLRGDAVDAAQEELGIDGDTVCQDDLPEIFEEAMGQLDGSGLGFGLGGIDDLVVPGLDPAQGTFGITATRVDGQWYVAPIRTFADLGIAGLRTVEREDLEVAVDAIKGFFGGGFFGGGMVGEGFVPPGLTDDLEGWSEHEELFDIGEPVWGEPGS
ncbi:MAG TPA: hypothetical protein VFV42_07220 [Acidimicrobiales bacterium]|nr:hypothetical protein [Acidimicrobiales bacterium]